MNKILIMIVAWFLSLLNCAEQSKKPKLSFKYGPVRNRKLT